jgi:uncharacterized repeat protein (TIGR03943 family)
VNTRTQAFALLLFGATLLRLATTDALLRYVRPVARPWIVLAALVMLGLAIWTLVAESRSDLQRCPGRDSTDEPDHHGGSRAAWLVLAPVVAILVVAPPALGAYTAMRLPVSQIKTSSRHVPPLNGADPVAVSLLDYYGRAAFDGGRTLAGHHIKLTGFVLRAMPNGFEMARLVITCCAADARPVIVSVRTQGPTPSRDAWVTVTGEYGGMSPSDYTVPVLRALNVTPTRQPDNPYD